MQSGCLPAGDDVHKRRMAVSPPEDTATRQAMDSSLAPQLITYAQAFIGST